MFEDTWTCYSNREDGLADATTPSSSLRLAGFLESGYRDPIKYAQQDKIDELYQQRGCRAI
jgi:7-cyano-7-deazaguanine synthase in queuosine biosynthesis